MNLQEQISRIQSMMVINEDKKYDHLKNHFDKIFDNLELVKTEYDIHQYNWINKDGKKIFERNHWGTFWIYGCDEYSTLSLLPKIMELSFEEFEEKLIKYLNNRYKKQFGDEKPLKVVGNENCDEYEG